MLAMLTRMRPAYLYLIILFYKTLIPDTRVLVTPNIMSWIDYRIIGIFRGPLLGAPSL